jgi:hypothetical protein
MLGKMANHGGTGFQPVLAQAKACGYIFFVAIFRII